MKKIFLLLSFIVPANTLSAQIILEHEYNSVVYDDFMTTDGVFMPVQISQSETKYAAIDNSTITLYSLDHIVFKVINIPLQNFNQNEDVDYITSTLFDNDSTNVEFLAVGQNLSGVWGAHVIREDGTILLSAQGFSMFLPIVIPGLSKPFQNILNTPQGTKLLLVNSGNGNVKVWSLPGTYYPLTELDESMENMEVGLPVPNPAVSHLELPVMVPYTSANPRLVMYSESGGETLNLQLTPGQRSVTIDTGMLASGMYMVTIVAENGRSKTRKVMIR